MSYFLSVMSKYLYATSAFEAIELTDYWLSHSFFNYVFILLKTPSFNNGWYEGRDKSIISSPDEQWRITWSPQIRQQVTLPSNYEVAMIVKPTSPGNV